MLVQPFAVSLIFRFRGNTKVSLYKGVQLGRKCHSAHVGGLLFSIKEEKDYQFSECLANIISKIAMRT